MKWKTSIGCAVVRSLSLSLSLRNTLAVGLNTKPEPFVLQEHGDQNPNQSRSFVGEPGFLKPYSSCPDTEIESARSISKTPDYSAAIPFTLQAPAFAPFAPKRCRFAF